MAIFFKKHKAITYHIEITFGNAFLDFFRVQATRISTDVT